MKYGKFYHTVYGGEIARLIYLRLNRDFDEWDNLYARGYKREVIEDVYHMGQNNQFHWAQHQRAKRLHENNWRLETAKLN